MSDEEVASHSINIRCSRATRVGSWVSSVLAVLAAIHAIQDRSWQLGVAALTLGAFAAISYRKSLNDFITIDDHHLTVSNHPWGDAKPETLSWSAILEADILLAGLRIRTEKQAVRLSLKEFPAGTSKQVVKAIKDKAPWATVKRGWG